MRLRIWSSRRYLPPDVLWSVLFYPFWGLPPEDPANPLAGRFDRYAREGGKWFEMAPLETADLAVLPTTWSGLMYLPDGASLVREFAREAGRYQVPVVVFTWSELDEPLPIAPDYVVRHSYERSRTSQADLIAPAWCGDLIERYSNGVLPLRTKGPMPVVGFCGNAPTLRHIFRENPRQALHWAACTLGLRKLHRSHLYGHVLRRRALRILGSSQAVVLNSVVRQSLWGGALHDGTIDLALQQQVHREFVQNLLASDYALCVRGDRNFSYRFCEALCCGRIPVVVDTDVAFPFPAHIPWERHCVIVPADDLSSMPKRVAEFHRQLGDQDFSALQEANRRLWIEWLSPEGYFSKLHLLAKLRSSRSASEPGEVRNSGPPPHPHGGGS
ncbi:MAG: exostosin family protein [Nitrospirae bacterium]|nr:exostosin family protein [Nitrospirota bacterium]